MTRDELFVEIALKAKLLTPAQIEDCRRLHEMLSEQSFQLTLPEIVTRKEFLSADQLRLVNVAVRYEEKRGHDRDLADFIRRKGFLAPEKINDCLTAQEAPYREGRHFPKLQDLLVERKHLSPQQLHVILRAWEQLDPTRRDGSSPHVAPSRPAVPPPSAELPTPPPIPVRARPAAAIPKKLEAGFHVENLKVGLRKTRLKEGPGELLIHVLDLGGSLDGHSCRRLDSYMNDLIDAGAVRFVVMCEKLEYISSAGIGVLAGAVKRCRDEQGDLRLAAVDDNVKKIMNLVGLQSLVRMYDNERGAVMSFKYG